MFFINPRGAAWGHRVPAISKCLEILALCLFLDWSWKDCELGTAGTMVAFTLLWSLWDARESLGTFG